MINRVTLIHPRGEREKRNFTKEGEDGKKKRWHFLSCGGDVLTMVQRWVVSMMRGDSGGDEDGDDEMNFDG